MNLVLRQKIFSLFRDRYHIKDDQGNDVFVVEPIFGVFAKYNIFSVADGKQLYRIERKVLTFLPKFEIYNAENQLVYVVKSRFTFFRPRIDIFDAEGKVAFELKGNIFAFQYSIEENGKVVAMVSKKLISLSDTYYLQIEDEKRAALFLCLAMIFDNIHHNGKNR